MNMRKILLAASALLCLHGASAQEGLTASFGAQESMITYYSQGWDSAEQFASWSYTATNTSKTWVLNEKPFTSNSEPFTVVNDTSKSSLCLPYGKNQNETATSPAIEIKPNSVLEFYSYANAGFLLYGSWTLNVIEGETTTKLLNQFEWAQKNAYDGQRWVKFSIDLDAYVGKKVKFSFNYKGDQGEDVAIDGFAIKQNNTSPNAVISIFEGEQVHFTNMSTGGATSCNWTFAGGTPATSAEQNPVVTYSKAGTYDVMLTVGNGTTTVTAKRAGYVVVKQQAPVARIGMPAEAYLSPFKAAFVPVNVPVTFRDESTGNPTSWKWTFRGCTPLSSTEQNPTVTYTTPGVYSLALQAQNDAGHSDDAMLHAVQAGGAQYVWNIAPEENSNLVAVEMGWYGNYAGTNWLGIKEFAEHYIKPLAPATIDSVAVYFAKVKSANPNKVISLSLMTPNEQGMPGQVLATATLKASELKCDAQNVVETMFHFDAPVSISTDFFLKVGNFELPDNGYDIAIFVARRGKGEKTTAYQYVLDEDGKNGYLATGKWFKNVDDPVSMAISPIVSYDEVVTSVAQSVAPTGLIEWKNNQIEVMQLLDHVTIYDAAGARVFHVKGAQGAINLDGLASGVYVVRAVQGSRVQTLKLVK